MKDAGGIHNPADEADPHGLRHAASAVLWRVIRHGNNIQGTATYKGAAAGKYALTTTMDDGYEGDKKTAKVTIQADFVADDADTPGYDFYGIAISGMIDNFMTGPVSPDWLVKPMADENRIDTALQSFNEHRKASGGALEIEATHRPLMTR